MFGRFLQGLTFAYRSRALLSPTLTEGKSLPIGVVIGAFSATLFTLMDSKTLGGSGVPSSSTTSAPAVCKSQSILRPDASIILTTASVISGPIPSPLIRVTVVIIFSFHYM